MNKITVIDNVLPDSAFRFLHTFLTRQPVWNLDMFSDDNSYRIAGRVLYDSYNNINSETSAQALCTWTYCFIADKAKFLSPNIKRIHLGGKVGPQKDTPHTDEDDKDTYTVLYYLTPDWKKSWGGETMVGKEKIEYVSNRAVIYPSNMVHGGLSTKTPVFRTYINYIVKQ